jgi:hypothetical protein
MAYYKLEIDRADGFVESSDENDWESIRCSADPDHQRAGRRVTVLKLDVVSSKVADFSRTMLSDVVITDHALEVLRSAKLTGFSIQQAVASALPGRLEDSGLPTLWEFVVTGRGGPAHKDSRIVELRRCDECGLVEFSAFYGGIIVNESTYDGSDFFVVSEYPKYILVSERAKSVIEKHGLTNIGFVESSRLKWPGGVAKPS